MKLSEHVPSEVQEMCVELDRYAKRKNYKHKIKIELLSTFLPSSRPIMGKVPPYIYRKFDHDMVRKLTCIKSGKSSAELVYYEKFWTGVARTHESSGRAKDGRNSSRPQSKTNYCELLVMLSEAYELAQKQLKLKNKIKKVGKVQRLEGRIESAVKDLAQMLQKVGGNWTVLEILESDPKVKPILFNKMLIAPRMHDLPDVLTFLRLLEAYAKKELKHVLSASQLRRGRSDVYAFVGKIYPYLNNAYGHNIDTIISSAVVLLFGDYNFTPEMVKEWRMTRTKKEKASTVGG
jgi:hypothetical protein